MKLFHHLTPRNRRFGLCSTAALVVLVCLAGCGGGSGSSTPSPGGGGNGGGGTPNPVTDANAQHNLDRLNAYRAQRGLGALTLDAGLSEFARQGSIELMQNHVAHKHFVDASNNGTLFTTGGFRNSAGENQGDPNGWPAMPVDQAIDQILQAMINEGVGGGHYENIMNPAFTRVGIGLVLDPNGKLYFTNDFSG